jgi:delta-like protein
MDENGFPFVGKFCEHVTMEKCGTKGVFCVNGGECNRFGTQCDCSPGFEGPHCEFKKGSVPVCDLQCENSGECQLGLPKEPNDFHDLKNLYLTNTSTTEDAMHCICPPGFGGKLCTAQKDKCGSEHCYHGGTCVSRVDDGKYEFKGRVMLLRPYAY